MLDHFKNYRSFLPLHIYTSIDALSSAIGEKMIGPAEKALALAKMGCEAPNNRLNLTARSAAALREEDTGAAG
jgi:hypothetical protein